MQFSTESFPNWSNSTCLSRHKWSRNHTTREQFHLHGTTGGHQVHIALKVGPTLKTEPKIWCAWNSIGSYKTETEVEKYHCYWMRPEGDCTAMNGSSSEEWEAKGCRHGSTLIFLQARHLSSPTPEVKLPECTSDADTSLILPENTGKL